ncbi:MAG: DUF732 domain-containing protein [Mycobacterium sp.]|uniref:DUF732 domain-containing protein n=1 Tax=Mycobacterium sp. TaxID=1785 RepID=UPI001EB2B0F4|nr:DUF732 domain-containing protein [Mycobacterium sp.]MBV8785855.1 DUF732 domain-containing protein [Mycobacterium sp.]
MATGIASIGLLAAAPIAQADSTDQKFLNALKEQGITDDASASHAIEAAHFVCVRLDNGQSAADVAQDVMKSSHLPEFHTGFFVAESIYAYCPRHTDEIPPGS